jgi:integration host factor subunit alpha
LTKFEIAELLLGTNIFINLQEAKEVVDGFFLEISDALAQGESVKLQNFGNFYLRKKRARPGRNPRTGEIVQVSGRRVVTFRISQKLAQCVEQGESDLGGTSPDAC